MHRGHHGDIDIAAAGGLDPRCRGRLGLRRAGIAIEDDGAFGQPGQGGERRLMRLVGGDDEEHGRRPGDSFGRARGADHVRQRIVGALAGANLDVRRIGLDVVGRDPGGESGFRAPAVEKGARGLAEADEGDRTLRDRFVGH